MVRKATGFELQATGETLAPEAWSLEPVAHTEST
jgi:hypothetical protein